ncbi:DoxX family protein [Candidatus Obscuribacterales bacterium]|nr:DoxX family protein [Candidatus Obscuribacterales bacterium]
MQTNRIVESLLGTTAPAAVLVIRLLTGTIFLSEGIQKFLYPGDLGVGRFEKLGIIYPSITAPFVGTVEIICGILLLLGLLIRLAAIPLLITMCVAIVSTKFNVLMESGFWKFAHEARTDYSMIMSLIFLLIVGAGSISLDNTIIKRRRSDANT